MWEGLFFQTRIETRKLNYFTQQRDMATRGRKPQATVVKLVTGNPGNRPIPEGEPLPDGRPECPKSLTGRARRYWEQYIDKAFWLTFADTQKAVMWCHLAAEFERDPERMIAARIGQLRALGSELGFDPASRARLGSTDGSVKKKDPAAQYFD